MISNKLKYFYLLIFVINVLVIAYCLIGFLWLGEILNEYLLFGGLVIATTLSLYYLIFRLQLEKNQYRSLSQNIIFFLVISVVCAFVFLFSGYAMLIVMGFTGIFLLYICCAILFWMTKNF
jgi:hypothetical protein